MVVRLVKRIRVYLIGGCYEQCGDSSMELLNRTVVKNTQEADSFAWVSLACIRVWRQDLRKPLRCVQHPLRSDQNSMRDEERSPKNIDSHTDFKSMIDAINASFFFSLSHTQNCDW